MKILMQKDNQNQIDYKKDNQKLGKVSRVESQEEMEIMYEGCLLIHQFSMNIYI